MNDFKVGDEVICMKKVHFDEVQGQIYKVIEILEKPFWVKDFRTEDRSIHLFYNFKKFTFNKDMKEFLDE